jgi:hypothetical protein
MPLHNITSKGDNRKEMGFAVSKRKQNFISDWLGDIRPDVQKHYAMQ